MDRSHSRRPASELNPAQKNRPTGAPTLRRAPARMDGPFFIALQRAVSSSLNSCRRHQILLDWRSCPRSPGQLSPSRQNPTAYEKRGNGIGICIRNLPGHRGGVCARPESVSALLAFERRPEPRQHSQPEHEKLRPDTTTAQRQLRLGSQCSARHEGCRPAIEERGEGCRTGRKARNQGRLSCFKTRHAESGEQDEARGSGRPKGRQSRRATTLEATIDERNRNDARAPAVRCG
jgi:hypothetical protein